MLSFLSGLLANGLTSVNLRDLEKQFGFSSKEASYILISNDIAGLLIVPLVSFYGDKGHKPKWIGIGSIVIGEYNQWTFLKPVRLFRNCLETRIKLYLSSDCSDETRCNTISDLF